MKKFFPILLWCSICLINNRSHAQLAFNKNDWAESVPYTHCENKWVALPIGKDSFAVGFIYIDASAGFTFDLANTFTINNGLVEFDKSEKNYSYKYRIPREWHRVFKLPASYITAFGLKDPPDWLSIYQSFSDTVKRYVRWGYLYNDVDESAMALPYLEKANRMQPHAPGLDFELIFAYNALERYDDAIKAIRSAMENDPNNVMFLRELGFAYLHSDKLDDAIETYKKGIERCTDQQLATKAEMAINLSAAYKKKGNMEEYKTWGNKAKLWAPPGSPIYKHIVQVGF